MQRVAVKGTPLRVAHYAEADLFAVLACRQVRLCCAVLHGTWRVGLLARSGPRHGW